MIRTLLLLLSWMPMIAAAAFPSPELLDELRRHLTEPAKCHPACAAMQTLELDLGVEQWRIGVEIHAQVAVAVPLPAAEGQWWPDAARFGDSPKDLSDSRETGAPDGRSMADPHRLGVDTGPLQPDPGPGADGRAGAVDLSQVSAAVREPQLARDTTGGLWVLAPAGRHWLQLSGAAPRRSQVDLPLPVQPGRVIDRSTAQAWRVVGVNADGVVGTALQLLRQRSTTVEQGGPGLEPGVLPPLLQVTRTLDLGLEWSVRTQIERQSPPGAALTIDLPLLDGEALSSEGVEVRDGIARVVLAADANRVTLQSRLAQRERLVLRAAQQVPWLEVWQVDAAPLWHLDFNGPPIVHHQDGQGAWLPSFSPWPGEQLEILVSRPAPVPGNLLTIESSRLQFTPGRRASDGSLSLTLRASQGGQHRIGLPAGAVLRQAGIEGSSQPLRLDGDGLSVPVRPGSQVVQIEWRQDLGLQTWLETPTLDLGVPSVNHSISVDLGAERWLLYVQGPTLGPAVLFWSVLAVILLFSVLLGRSGLAPLRSYQWLLLGIGLTQSNLLGAILIVAWLLLLALRERLPEFPRPLHHNAMQVGILLLTLVALSALFDAVSHGLLGEPSMQVRGNASHAQQLHWYQDRVAQQPAQAAVLSLPLWVYRVAMLAWALWLAFALLGWLRWAWQVFSRDTLWRRVSLTRQVKARAQTSPPAAPSTPGALPPT